MEITLTALLKEANSYRQTVGLPQLEILDIAAGDNGTILLTKTL